VTSPSPEGHSTSAAPPDSALSGERGREEEKEEEEGQALDPHRLFFDEGRIVNDSPLKVQIASTRPIMSLSVRLLLFLSLLAQGVSGQLSLIEGLESDACVNQTLTLEDILSGVRDGSSGFFQGGLGGMAQGNWRTYGCWRKHACLDALNASGVDTTGDAICYKFNSAQHSWLLPSTP